MGWDGMLMSETGVIVEIRWRKVRSACRMRCAIVCVWRIMNIIVVGA